jgi:hypothetical protein
MPVKLDSSFSLGLSNSSLPQVARTAPKPPASTVKKQAPAVNTPFFAKEGQVEANGKKYQLDAPPGTYINLLV